MGMRGWENVTADQLKQLGKQPAKLPKPSKYRNVRVVVDGQTFDSKREASYYLGLKAREAAGEIEDLKRQVAFPLLCPTHQDDGMSSMVAFYVADFTYIDVATKRREVVDSKGHGTQIYQLKKKWLFLQDGIEIQEV